ncbi:hypothetical protein KZZ52_18775 [Dactylosporangium sp. AC04546]|uniref:hypothetical protein n=1 Tax=Dactylosporangium sp. AC04546 TaxID=2862460 RepID=UPI001EDDCBA8|nr:hypothetical protein [Dactylosporangium sp. AC04546]WVK87348.1 hypothetical protein KZZ52_18775 [Dactylosporangium sp. AC04546]
MTIRIVVREDHTVMSSSGPALAVDVGAFACTATLVVDGEARAVPEAGTGARRWPSAVLPDGDGWLVGTAAQRRRRTDPGLDPLSGDPSALAPLLAAITAEAGRLSGLSGGTFDRIVLTARDLPAQTLVAAVPAGPADAEVLDAAVAVALDPLLPPAGTTLVCDVGRGATVSVVRDGAVLGRATAGAGGAALEELLVARIVADGPDWAAPLLAVPRGRAEVADFAARIVHGLSGAEEIEEYLTPLAPPYRFTRADLAAVAAPFGDRLAAALRAALEQAATRPDSVVLAGGAALSPVVADLVRRTAAALGLPSPQVTARPEGAASRGTAAWAATAADRVLPARAVPRHTRPVAWAVPGGSGILTRWLAGAGDSVAAGAAVATVRTAEGSLLTLTVPEAGVLTEPRAPVGAVIAGDRPAATLRLAPPAERMRHVAGLVCDREPVLAASVLAGTRGTDAWTFDLSTGALHRFRPDLHAAPAATVVTAGPDGRAVLAVQLPGMRHLVFDIAAGKVLADVTDPAGDKTFALDGPGWRLVTSRFEAPSRLFGRRGTGTRTYTVWDLATGRPLSTTQVKPKFPAPQRLGFAADPPHEAALRDGGLRGRRTVACSPDGARLLVQTFAADRWFLDAWEV